MKYYKLLSNNNFYKFPLFHNNKRDHWHRYPEIIHISNLNERPVEISLLNILRKLMFIFSGPMASRQVRKWSYSLLHASQTRIKTAQFLKWVKSQYVKLIQIHISNTGI